MVDSEAVQTHVPCPLCGSHDAATIYSDGHLYCFSCQGYVPGDRGGYTVSRELLTGLDYVSLNKRKITAETCQKYGYGVTTVGDKTYQVAPYYDQDNNLVAQHLRGADKSFSWRGQPKNLQLFGQQLFSGNGKMVVVTEGEIDCLTVSQVQGNKWPVVSLTNGVGSAVKAFKDNLEWLESYEKVVICFDMDEPGRKAAEQAAQVLSPGKAYVMELPLKDPNDMLQAGKTEELINRIWQAKPYRPDGIISGADLWDEIIKEPEKGYKTPFHKLNTMTEGIRKKELWLLTAGSGIGKSTIVHELAYDLMMNHGCTIGVMALEESKRRAAERYLSIYLNKPLHLSREGVTEEQLKAAYDATIGQEGRFYLYDHFGSSDIDTLMSRIRFMAVTCNIDFLILDHISIVVSGLRDAGTDERKQIDTLMTMLRSLVEETGIGVLGVVHLKRPPQGESWNEGKEPSLTDLRGSGGLEQLSDMVIALSRNQTDEEQGNKVKLVVLKNRFTGVIGAADVLEYIPRTGRLVPSSESDDSPFGKVETNEIDRKTESPSQKRDVAKRTRKKRNNIPSETGEEVATPQMVGMADAEIGTDGPLEGEVDF